MKIIKIAVLYAYRQHADIIHSLLYTNRTYWTVSHFSKSIWNESNGV